MSQQQQQQQTPDLLELATLYCRGEDDLEIEAVFRGITEKEFDLLVSELAKEEKPQVRVDVSIREKRFTISSDAATLAYISRNRIDDPKTVTTIAKKTIARWNPRSNYVVNLKRERKIPNNFIELFEVRVPPTTKHYRIIKRYSVVNLNYRIDLSVVRSATSSLPRMSDVSKFEYVTSYEAEVEFVGVKEAGPQAVVDAIEAGISSISSVLGGSSAVSTESNETLEEYAAFFHTKNFIGPNPVTLRRVNLLEPDVDIISVREDYVVTEKADGFRAGLFVDSTGLPFVCVREGSTLSFSPYSEERFQDLKNSYLDCEMVANKNLLAFDVYLSSGLSTIDMDFAQRLSLLSRFEKVVELKKYRPAVEACKLLDEINAGAFSHQVDGLIYMPLKLSVGATRVGGESRLTGHWPNVFKWKPSLMNSIDFLVDLDRDRNIGYLYLEWSPDRIEPIAFYTSQPVKRNNNRKLFEPSPTVPLALDPKKNGYYCENGDRIESGSIVEFRYFENQFHPMRVRADKVRSNYYDVAMDVWDSIVNPVTRGQVCLSEPIEESKSLLLDDKYWQRTGDSRKSPSSKAMREFHYWVKQRLFDTASVGNKKRLLDLCCGQGGDLTRYRASKFERVLGLDLYDESIAGKNGVLARMGSPNVNPGYLFARYDLKTPFDPEHVRAAEDDDWKSLLLTAYGLPGGAKLNPERTNMAPGGFDVVACMFAVHYFFGEEGVLDTFVSSVVSNMKKDGGGIFVGCCFDAERLLELLSKGPKQVGKSSKGLLTWSIEGSNFESSSPYGREIEVYVDSIGRKTTEYLVDMDELVSKFADRGVTLLGTGTFDELYAEYMESNNRDEMDESEKRFSFMNRFFIFQG